MVESDGRKAAGLPRFLETRSLAKTRFNDGKLDPLTLDPDAQQLANHQPQLSLTELLPSCPECGAAPERIYKCGWRHTNNGPVQRYMCRNCGYRFSHSCSTRESFKPLNLPPAHTSSRQACDDLAERASNAGQVLELAISQQPEKQAQREGTTQTQTADQAAIKGLLAQFAAYLEKEGYSSENDYYNLLKRLAKRGADLLDPESVKVTVAKMKKPDGAPCKDGTKMLTVEAYKCFAMMLNIKWTPPKYKQEEIIPWTPEEIELDQLIAGCQSRRMAAFLECLKETYTDPLEALRIQWGDVDFEHKIITINHPCKGHLPGKMPVKTKLLAMLDLLPRKNELVFATTYPRIASVFWTTRRRVAARLQNPRILRISFRSFRHWGGTMVAYHANGNMLVVKKALRHKQIASSMKYVSDINFEEDDFETATATTVDEAKKLAEAGFQKFDEYNGIHIYRRPKRFQH